MIAVDFSKHPFRLKLLEGKEIEALAVIVATAARQITWGWIPKSASRMPGLGVCRVRWRRRGLRNKPPVVVGGATAMEEAVISRNRQHGAHHPSPRRFAPAKSWPTVKNQDRSTMEHDGG